MTLMNGWFDEARKAAQLVIDRYGEPHEATDSLLIWHDVGPWKRIMASVERSGVARSSPVGAPGVGLRCVAIVAPFDSHDLAERSGVPRAYVERLVDLGLIRPQSAEPSS